MYGALLFAFWFVFGLYDRRMQTIEIDPELNRRALAEAAEKYPEFAGRALRVVARPLFQGFAWQLEWDGTPRPGSPRGNFKTLPSGHTRDWPASTGNLAPCRCRIKTPATKEPFRPRAEWELSPYSALAGPIARQDNWRLRIHLRRRASNRIRQETLCNKEHVTSA